MIGVRIEGETDLRIVQEADEDFRRTGAARVDRAAMILERAVLAKYRRITGDSRPGQPPARDTGDLAASVNRTRARRVRDAFEAVVGAMAVYAARLEYGGRDSRGVYIAPRPAWRPAMLENRRRIENALEGK
jgi:phage gpG-like protein